MNYCINLWDEDAAEILVNLPIAEVLLQTGSFSRSGGIDDSSLNPVIAKLKRSGKRVVLAWDCLAKDSHIEEASNKLKSLLHLHQIHSIRFLDPGIGCYLKSKFPECKLELSLEHGSFNLHAILGWIKCLQPQLTRVVLSNQLPILSIAALRSQIPVEVELLGYGPLEIFYSRRKLINDQPVTHTQTDTKLALASDDRPKQANSVFINDMGTTIAYDKWINLFGYHDQIIQAGVNVLRLEYRFRNELKQLIDIFNDPDWVRRLGNFSQTTFVQGFFEKNISHHHFDQLTNQYLVTEKQNQAGIILESVKHDFCILRLDKPTTLPQSITITSPEGRKIQAELRELMDLRGQRHLLEAKQGVYQISWIKYVSPGSVICFV